jgi:hypothetical protein
MPLTRARCSLTETLRVNARRLQRLEFALMYGIGPQSSIRYRGADELRAFVSTCTALEECVNQQRCRTRSEPCVCRIKLQNAHFLQAEVLDQLRQLRPGLSATAVSGMTLP